MDEVNFHETLAPLVKQMTDSVHSSFPQHHLKSDTESALWVWVYENKNTVEDILYKGRYEGPLKYLMRKVANTYLMNEDAAAYGYSQEDAFNYTTNTVKVLLDSVFEYENWQSFGDRGDGQPRAKGQVNQTGDQLAMLVDLATAIRKLKVDQRQIIFLYYRDHWTAPEIAADLDITEEAAKKRLSRAVGALRKLMGSKPYSEFRKGFSGRTEPSSTAAAVARTERDYEG